MLNVGDTLRLAASDYLNSFGDLHLRVAHVPAGLSMPGLEWAQIMGVELLADGSDGRHRIVLVRVAALRSTTTSRRQAANQ